MPGIMGQTCYFSHSSHCSQSVLTGEGQLQTAETPSHSATPAPPMENVRVVGGFVCVKMVSVGVEKHDFLSD